MKQGLVERGIFDQVKSSFMEMARFNVEWNFKDISIKDLPVGERVEIRKKLGLDDSECLEKNGNKEGSGKRAEDISRHPGL